jgi:hypothetical protein
MVCVEHGVPGCARWNARSRTGKTDMRKTDRYADRELTSRIAPL